MPTNKKSPRKKPANKKVIVKKSVASCKVLLLVVLTILIVLILVGFHKSSKKVNIITSSYPSYVTSLQNTINSAVTNLDDPFTKLGYTSINKKPVKCSLLYSEGATTQLDCSGEYQAYTRTPRNPLGETNLENQAQLLQTLLIVGGWQAGGNGVTLTSLIDGTYKGIDYSPDAAYLKNINGNSCIFDTDIAYSNPNPTAINSTLSCSRTVSVTGIPKGSFYENTPIGQSSG